MVSAGGSGSRTVTVLLTTAAVICSINTAIACPITCECRWKRGKQTVECLDKGLITVPVNIAPGTQVLSMSGNNIRIVPAKKFKSLGLINLQRIHMPRCRIFEIDNRAFSSLTNLIELDLSDNELNAVPSGVFRDTPSLMQLLLGGNPISKVSRSSLKGLPYLSTLDMSNCQLETIERGTFASLPKLQWLYLSGNRLTSLSSEGLLLTLHGLELQNNMWSCDCQLRSLRSWLQVYKMPPSVEPHCHSPKKLKGLLVREAEEEQLACPPQVTTDSESLEIPEGKNISLICRAHADPPANITWMFNGLPLYNTSKERYSLSQFEEGSSLARQSELIIFNSSVNDQGVFSCNVSNQAGRTLVNFTVRILLPPDSSSSETAPLDTHPPYLLIIMVTLVVTIALMALSLLAVVVRWCVCRRRIKKPVLDRRRDGTAKGSQTPNCYTLSTGLNMGTSSLHSSVSQSTTFTDCREGVSFMTQCHPPDKNPDIISIYDDDSKQLRQSEPSDRLAFEEVSKRSVRFNPEISCEDLTSNYIQADIHSTHDNRNFSTGLGTISRSLSHHQKFNTKSALKTSDFRSLPRRTKTGKHTCITYKNDPNNIGAYPHFTHILPGQSTIVPERKQSIQSHHLVSTPETRRRDSLCTCTHLPSEPRESSKQNQLAALSIAPCSVKCVNFAISDASTEADNCHTLPSHSTVPQLSPPEGFSDPQPQPMSQEICGDPNCSGLPDSTSSGHPDSMAVSVSVGPVNKLNVRVQGLLCPPHESPDEGYDETAADSTDV